MTARELLVSAMVQAASDGNFNAVDDLANAVQTPASAATLLRKAGIGVGDVNLFSEGVGDAGLFAATSPGPGGAPAETFLVVGSTPPPVSKDRHLFALPGPTGKRATDLLRAAMLQGAATYTQLAHNAITRLSADPDWRSAPTLFTPDELQRLSAALAAVNTPADLLARSAVLNRAAQVRAGQRFAESTGLETFAEPIPVVKPKEAINFFKNLIPRLGLDPERYGHRMERHAFTMCVASEKTLLEKVKQKLTEYLDEGTPGYRESGAHLVQHLMDDAGVSHQNPQYAEMVFRTNVLDSYHTGLDAQLDDPDLADDFPCWQYQGIDDERAGDDHRPKFGRYYPKTATFAEVRGNRPFNCRCTKVPIDRFTWAELQKQGAKVESSW